MAEGTSVGVVQLDVEINPQSLNSEMNKLGKAFNSSFKSMFSGMVGQANNFVKESIGKMANGFKGLARTGTGSSEKVSQSINKMNSQYEKTQSKIREIQTELNGVYSQLDLISAKYADFPALRGLTKSETMDQLLGADKEYQKLSAEAAKLEARLEPLTAQSRELSQAIGESGAAAQKASANLGSMRKSARNVMGSIFRLTWVKKIFNNEAKKASSTTSGLNTALSRMSRTIVRNLVVYGLIIKGLRGMISYMWSALKTNKEFSRSLDIIRTNLLVAFQPIYDFILPALNALMRAVATVTTYIASAISALFGRTYQQSFRAAKSLNTATNQMKGFGGAAKKAGKAAKKAGKDAKGALMPFDEINQLNLDKGADVGGAGAGGGGGGAGGFEMAMPDMSTIDMGGINKFKEIMSKIFEPFKLAWEKEGQATIDSMKYALGGIKDLTKAIGRSWLEVWTNGTGQKMLETMLRILQNIFGIVGDIARSFTRAWEEGGRGTAIMQHLHNIIQHILTFVEKLTKAFREVWGEVGDKLVTAFLDNLRGVLSTLDHLGGKLLWVWDHGGERMFKGFVRLGAKILEISYFINTEFVQPFVNWFIDLIAPAIAGVMDWVGSLLEKFTDLIDWLMGDGYPVLETIVTILGSMALAFGIVQGAVNLYKGSMAIAKAVSIGFKGAVAGLTSTFGIWVIAIGAAIAVGVLLYKNWDKIKETAGKLWEGIKDIFGKIGKWIGDTWDNVKKATSEKWGNIKNSLFTVWNNIKSAVSEKFNAIKNSITNIWNGIKTIATNTWNNIKNAILNPINAAKTAVSNTVNAIKNTVSNVFNSVKSTVTNTWVSIKNAIINPINKARDAVKTAIDKIKGIMNFKWSLPKLKLPHFKITGKFSLMPPSVPKIGVDWYDKGGIFTGPQIIGVGERRPEFVGALDDLREIVRDEIKNAGGENRSFGSGSSDRPIELTIQIGENKLGRIVIDSINKLQKQEGRILLEL